MWCHLGVHTGDRSGLTTVGSAYAGSNPTPPPPVQMDSDLHVCGQALASSGAAVCGSEWPYAGGRAEHVPKIITGSAMQDGWLPQDPSRIAAACLSACGVSCGGAPECQEHISDVVRRGGNGPG
jgi:hypothetical protein